VQVSKAGVTTHFDYNGLGDRLVENELQFVMDLNSGLTQALSDGTNTYLYDNGRIGQFSGVESAYFLGDALGSVRQLVDGDGLVSLVKSYEPYGKTAESTGGGGSAYSFTGEWASTAEMLYLRARFYSETGRFLTRDIWPGDYYEPISYNAWLYGFANPIKFTDPTGYNPNCKRRPAVCAKERLQEIINGAGNNGAEALFRTFEDWELEGLWSDAAGRNSRDRLEWLLGVTVGSPNDWFQKMMAPVVHVQMKYHFGDDCDFAIEFRDSQFYRTWKLKDKSNQAGHFLTAVGITYWWVIAGNIGSDPNYSHIWPGMGLAAIIGHEMLGDNEGGVFQQVWIGLSQGSEVFALWDDAVRYDS
jgi:RHS repeat-associated protein